MKKTLALAAAGLCSIVLASEASIPKPTDLRLPPGIVLDLHSPEFKTDLEVITEYLRTRTRTSSENKSIYSDKFSTTENKSGEKFESIYMLEESPEGKTITIETQKKRPYGVEITRITDNGADNSVEKAVIEAIGSGKTVSVDVDLSEKKNALAIHTWYSALTGSLARSLRELYKKQEQYMNLN